jgi:hypothetical protein
MMQVFVGYTESKNLSRSLIGQQILSRALIGQQIEDESQCEVHAFTED